MTFVAFPKSEVWLTGTQKLFRLYRQYFRQTIEVSFSRLPTYSKKRYLERTLSGEAQLRLRSAEKRNY